MGQKPQEGGKGSSMSDRIVTLKFDNRDATPHVVEMRVDRAAVKDIMAWYGAYFAGDDYAVFINGHPQGKDQNGEFEPVTITV
jgi:hypothetical protein